MIVLQIVNLDEVKRGHEDFLAKNQRLLQESAERGGKHAQDFVNRYPGFKRRTGKLQRSTKYSVVRLGSGRLLKIQNNQEYAEAIDTGARAHPISASKAPYLHFFWKRKGRWVRTKSVRHPGNRPYKTFYRATFSSYRLMGQDLQHGMRELAKRF